MDMPEKTPSRSWVDTAINKANVAAFTASPSVLSQTTYFAARWGTTLTVATGGSYTFSVTCTGAARLYVKDIMYTDVAVIVDDTHHDNAYTRASSSISLTAGRVPIVLQYFQNAAAAQVKLEYKGPDTSDSFVLVCSVGECTRPCVAACSRVMNNAPVISVSPPNPQYVTQGTTYSDPGKSCTDVQDGFVAVSSGTPNMAVAGTTSITYSCTDTEGYMVSATRSVIVRTPITLSIKGAQELTVFVGGTFVDEGACCTVNSAAAVAQTWGGVDVNTAGQYNLGYQCRDPSTSASSELTRIIMVDKAPSLELIGGATTQAVKGMGYSDPGLQCQDVEDDILTMRRADQVEQLSVIMVITSDGVASGSAIIDRSVDGTCSNILTVNFDTTKCSTATWVQLDLGQMRVVHKLKIYNVPAGLKVHVGSNPLGTSNPHPPTTGTCTLNAVVSLASNWQWLTCMAPQAGRYVTLYIVPNAPLTLPEVEVWGTDGPLFPQSFTFSGCGLSPTGTATMSFSVADAKDNFPKYGYAVDVLAARTVGSYVHYAPSLKRWEVYSGSELRATASSAGSLVDATWATSAAPHCEAPAAMFVAEDSCSWLFGYSASATAYLCEDGTQCATDGCCVLAYKCPMNKPQMCANTQANGKYICSTDCTSQGGIRQCQPALTGCFETNVMYTPDLLAPNGPLAVANTQDCQAKCQRALDCLRWTFDSSRICHLHGRSATKQSFVGSVAGPGTCVARSGRIGRVNTNVAGWYFYFYSCSDSVGQLVGKARGVQVTCEGPNPTGVYGGNKITCEKNLTVVGAPADVATCVAACLADSNCEAYSFHTGEAQKCKAWKSCDGRYYRDAGTVRQVGYCQRKDHPPKVNLEVAPCCVNIGETWAQTGYSCIDFEDPVPPTPVVTSTLNNQIPGLYTVTYSCTDRAGQTTTSNRLVTVKPKCSIPTGILSSNLAGPCAEGTAPIAHGSTCTARCEPGRVPSKLTLRCVSANDASFVSYWDDTIVCRDSPCTAPQVAYVKVAESEKSCAEATWVNNSYQIGSGSICTTNCKDGYVPSEESLTCDQGKFTPETFRCRLPAAKPEYVLFGKPGPTSVDVTWAGSFPQDCTFAGWSLQAILYENGVASGWFVPTGCSRLGVNGRSSDTRCTASDLIEGGVYNFRVREECQSASLNSEWQYSQNATMKIVIPPAIVFSVPVTDVTEHPGQFLIAYSVAVESSLLFFNDTMLVVTRFCPSGGPTQWQVAATNVSMSGLTGGSGCEIVGMRILIVSPAYDFLERGCLFNISIDAGFVQSEEKPAKKSQQMVWNFTFIDKRPYLLNFYWSNTLTATSQVTLQWSELCYFNCTMSPADIPGCQAAAAASSARTKSQKCQNVSAAWDMKYLDLTQMANFEIRGLYPGTAYVMNCYGYKFDGVPKPWILSLPTPDTMASSMFKTTMQDSDNTLKYIEVTIFARCDNGDIKLSRKQNLTTIDLSLGFTVQIADYSFQCLGGDLMEGGSANLTVVGTVQSSSPHAKITWTETRGPEVNFTYTRIGTTGIAPTGFFLWNICPLSKESNQGICVDYRLDLRVVDVTFGFKPLDLFGFALGLRSEVGSFGMGRRLAGPSSFTVSQGMQATVGISVSRPDFNWSTVSVTLGSPTVGFLLPSSYSAGNLSFELFGQGRNLPLLLMWQGASFSMDVLVSFVPPVMKLATLSCPPTAQSTSAQAVLIAPICCPPSDQSTLRFDLMNVPDTAALRLRGVSGGGYDLPSNYIQLSVIKYGLDPLTDSICSGTTFPTVGADLNWKQVDCILTPGALTNLTQVALIQDYSTGVKVVDSRTYIAGALTFANPQVSGVETANTKAMTADGVIDFGFKSTEIIITGTKFPRTRDVNLKAAKYNRYAVFFEMATRSVDVCETVTWVETAKLTCTLRKCVNLTGSTRFPIIRLWFGDLSPPDLLTNAVALPRPYILSFGPKELLDVAQNQTMWFEGVFFGEVTCPTLDGIHLIGRPQGADIYVGDLQAPCYVTMQNDSRLECIIYSQLMYPRRRDPADGFPWPLRSSPQPIKFLSGFGLEALNGEKLVGAYPSEPQVELPALSISVTLALCPDGQRRRNEGELGCEDCPPGRWALTTTDVWPLDCKACEAGKYQPYFGSFSCIECPVNTMSREGSVALTDCTCKPGYYSPYLNATTGYGTPGTSCVACHTTDLTQQQHLTDKCGTTVPVADVCDAVIEPTCINEAPPAISFRVCKAYCPGGLAWPKAKPTFWLLQNAQSQAGEFGMMRYEPRFVRCDPKEACTGHNSCKKMYEKETCGNCIFGYWRDKATNLCMPCGAEQVFGLIMASGMLVMMSVGGLFGATTFLRLQADIQFKNLAQTAVIQNIVMPIKKSTKFIKCMRRTDMRKTITLLPQEVGKSFSFSKRGDLGMVCRVDDNNVIHVCGLMQDSPLRNKAIPGWKLLTVNGKRLGVRTEAEVQAALRAAKFPLRLTFQAQRKTKAQLEQEAKGAGAALDLADDRKMMIIMLGVMNAFQQVSMFDFEWPPIFKKLAQLASIFSVNLNFFHPECSVAMPYIKKWMYMLSVPYAMMAPITAAYGIALILTLYKDYLRKNFKSVRVKFWLLRNAYARVCCMAAIMLLPFHYDQLLVPFACIERGPGTSFVAEMPETPCSLSDTTYQLMLQIAATGASLVCVGFSMLIYCLRQSFAWQFGARNRSSIPLYVAVVEVSTFGQRGYVSEVRARVMSNIVATRTFDPDSKKLEEREMALAAVDHLNQRHRNPKQRKAQEVHEGGAGEEKKPTDFNEHVADRLAILTAKRRFAAKQVWGDRPEGSIISYGWVLLVNMAWRQIASLMTIKLTKASLVAIGAGFQMIIFAGNITMLILFRPYKSERINSTEAILLTGLFAILWCAVLKDLLTNNINAHLFTEVLAKVSRCIEVLAIVVMILVAIVPLQQVFLIVTRAMLLFTGPDAVLNSIYMTQRMNIEKEKALQEKGRINDLLDTEDGGELTDDLADALAKGLPVLDESLRRFAERGLDNGTLDLASQRRKLLRLGKLVQSAQERKLRKVQQKLAQENAAGDRQAALRRRQVDHVPPPAG